MEFLTQFLDIVLHLDKHLALMVQQYGLWIYGILFFIIFAETGFVVTPFLPGDSLLFVAGIGSMSYAKFTLFNLIGALSWVVSLCLAGYWLGNIPWVKTNLSLIIVGIIISSLIPLGIGYVKSKAA